MFGIFTRRRDIEFARVLLYSMDRISQIYLPMSDNEFIEAIINDFPEKMRKIEGLGAIIALHELPGLIFNFSKRGPEREVTVLGRGPFTGFMLIGSPERYSVSASDLAITPCQPAAYRLKRELLRHGVEDMDKLLEPRS